MNDILQSLHRLIVSNKNLFFSTQKSTELTNRSLLEHQVRSAIYVTNLTLLKYFNLFETDPNRSVPYENVPFTPNEEQLVMKTSNNVASPSTSLDHSESFDDNDNLRLKQSIMTFPSILFTKTMVREFLSIWELLLFESLVILAVPRAKTSIEQRCFR